jgi:hypothetical protein
MYCKVLKFHIYLQRYSDLVHLLNKKTVNWFCVELFKFQTFKLIFNDYTQKHQQNVRYGASLLARVERNRFTHR